LRGFRRAATTDLGEGGGTQDRSGGIHPLGLTPKERFEAGMRIAREAFQNTTLTIEDIEAAVRRVRRKHHAAREKAARRR
jgi:hypothetical protein